MPILNGPMSINQLKAWAKDVSTWTQAKIASAMLQLDRDDPHEPRRVWGRRV